MCNDGFVLKDRACVPIRKCGCQDNKGQNHYVGDISNYYCVCVCVFLCDSIDDTTFMRRQETDPDTKKKFGKYSLFH